MSSRNTPLPHPPEEQLLRLSDGELTPREAAAVRSHLEQCWHCRGRMDEMEAGIADYMRYEERVLKPLLPGPPRPWADLERRLEQLDATAAKSAKMRLRSFPTQWFAAAAAAVIAMLLLWRFERVPEVRAAELLNRAAAQEAIAPPTPRQIRVRTRRANFVRAASLARIPSIAALADSEAPADLRKLFEEAHYNWDNPLSVEAYRAWREQLSEKEEEVTRGTSTAADYVIRTSSRVSILTEATLTLRARDLHAIYEKLQFQPGEWVELTELAEQTGPMHERPLVSALPASAPPAAIKEKQGKTPPSAAGPAEELKAVVALHRIGADLGEPVEISRQGSTLIVAALGLSASRREQLRAAVASIPGVELRFDEPQLMTSRPSVVVPQRRNPSGTLNAFQLQLQNQLGDPASVEPFTNGVLDASEEAMARAYALRVLARRFTPDVEAQLDPAERETLAGLRRDHLETLSAKALAIERQLRPLLSNLAPSPGGAATEDRSPRWQNRAQALFTAMERVDRLLNAMLAGGDDAGGAQSPSELAVALSNLGAQLAEAR